MLMSHLEHLKAPHRKITELLKSGDIIRVKKGLYVFGVEYRQNPVHLGLLANLIYGPSYVSQEYALYWYGMIPERVDMITSMTNRRNKSFDTPLGVFRYTYLNNQRYTVGIDWKTLDNGQHFLMASPEKALIDTIASCTDITTRKAMRLHLIENLRIDENILSELDISRTTVITQAYAKPVIRLLAETIKEGL
jgi:predicted transcriptional regulator of viral defense system